MKKSIKLTFILILIFTLTIPILYSNNFIPADKSKKKKVVLKRDTFGTAYPNGDFNCQGFGNIQCSVDVTVYL